MLTRFDSISKMIFLFALLFGPSDGSQADVLSFRKCTKVNGVAGACNLHLNYFTLAGSVSAGRCRVLVCNIDFVWPDSILNDQRILPRIKSLGDQGVHSEYESSRK